MISCGTLGPILIPGTVDLITEFGLDFAQLSQVCYKEKFLTLS